MVVLLVAVPPVLLLRLTGWPLPAWPSGEQLRGWVAEPVTTGTVTAALAIGGWLLWLLVVVVTVLRVTARVRVVARWMRRMPLPTPWQATATGLAGVAVLGTNTAATAAPLAEQPTATTTPTAGDKSREPADRQVPDLEGEVAGVVVPGGWLPRGTAEQVAAAAALLWLWRRRSYRPATPGPERRDPDLAPLPAVVVAAQTAVTTGTGQSGDRTGQDSHTVGDQGGPGPAVVVFPPGGVGLTGPGASDAARGILVTAALRALRDPTPVVRLITTRADLDALLGPHPPVPALTGIHVAATLDDALALAAPSSTTATPHGAARTTGLDRLLLLTHATGDRLAAAVADHDLAVVVVGGCPGGDTWRVNASGHIHTLRHVTDRRRMCVLDVAATRDILTVISPPDIPTTGDAPTPAPQVLPPPRPRTPDQGAIQHTRSGTGRPGPVALRLRVLGGVNLYFQDTPVPVRRSAALQALVLLAVHPDGATGRDLIETIWPGLPAHRVSGRLYTTLSDLRKAIRDAGGETAVEQVDDRYRLNPELDVDLWRLRHAVGQAATTLTGRSRAWQTVIDRYGGLLADGHTWPWLDPHRENVRRHVIDAHVALADAHTDPRQALTLLQDAIRVDPYNENLHQRAAHLLTVLGDHDTATELLDGYRDRLTAAGLVPAARTAHAGIRPS